MSVYDLVVVGGGTAGLTAAVGAAGQGARTLLIERDRTGGDCLWTGCVPSKALLSVAERVHGVRAAAAFGVTVSDLKVDFSSAMAHVKNSIATIAPHDSVERLRGEGVEVIAGTGKFVGPDRIAVGGDVKRFRHAMIATGAAPVVPPIPGLDASAPLTSDSLWDLAELPSRLVVLGGGPIGVELGQAFARLGSQVTLVEMADRVLPRDDEAASDVVARSLIADGVDVRASTTATRVEQQGDGFSLVVERDGQETSLPFDRILVAVGRRPNVEGLGLSEAGVELNERRAVKVDKRLRTSNRRIYAGGDVTMLLPFTHTAGTHGATVVQNALFGLRRTVDHARIPWVTFTSPEVATVGLSAAEARQRFGDRAVVRKADHAKLDRAITAGETDGFAMLIGDPKGRLVGATVVGPRAGETIGEAVAWLAAGAKLSGIVQTTHAYPTWNQDLANASLDQLQAQLAQHGKVTAAVRKLRRVFPATW